MKTKIVNGTFHLEREMKIYFAEEIRSLKQLDGRLRIVEEGGTTYVVCPISEYILEGLIFPITEDYDSLEGTYE